MVSPDRAGTAEGAPRQDIRERGRLCPPYKWRRRAHASPGPNPHASVTSGRLVCWRDALATDLAVAGPQPPFFGPEGDCVRAYAGAGDPAHLSGRHRGIRLLSARARQLGLLVGRVVDRAAAASARSYAGVDDLPLAR